MGHEEQALAWAPLEECASHHSRGEAPAQAPQEQGLAFDASCPAEEPQEAPWVLEETLPQVQGPPCNSPFPQASVQEVPLAQVGQEASVNGQLVYAAFHQGKVTSWWSARAAVRS